MRLRCTRCHHEVDLGPTSEAEGEVWDEVQVAAKDAKSEMLCCPNCGTTSVPCDVAQDVQVTINWHELRILTIWAENYAARCDQMEDEGSAQETLTPVVKAIAKRLQVQHPSRTPLTLSGEFAQLRKAHPSMEVRGNVQPDDDMLPPTKQ